MNPFRFSGSPLAAGSIAGCGSGFFADCTNLFQLSTASSHGSAIHLQEARRKTLLSTAPITEGPTDQRPRQRRPHTARDTAEEPTKGKQAKKEKDKHKELTTLEDQTQAQTKDQINQETHQPSSYNIFYDDPDYDYLQHLRPIGTSSDAIFLEKPTTNKKPPSKQPISLVPSEELLPNTVQATPDHQTLSYQDHLEFALPSNSAIPDDSLFPISDDPALREVLEALEDEAYVEEETDDNFFESIIKDGEVDPNEPLDEPDLPKSQWESEISRFKQTKSSALQFDDTSSITSDTLNSQKPLAINARKVNRSAISARGSVAGSAFSMSSSAMFRNEGLTDLDDRFDQIEKEYQSDDDDDESNCSEVTTTPKVREDFEAIMDEFLDRFEVLGGKMKPALAGKTPIEKLDTLRAELLGPSSHDTADEGDDALERKLVKEKILAHLRAHQLQTESLKPKNQSDNLVFNRFEVDDDKYENKWDCQTILSTYSNLENHPRVIRIREAIGGEEGKKKKTEKVIPSSGPTSGGKIGIDRATGFPVVDGKVITPSSSKNPSGLIQDVHSDDDSDSDDQSTCSVKGIIKRDRNEDKESKKIRKAQVKAERAVRRQVKKSIKQSFTKEKNKQESINSKLLVKKSVDIAGMGGKHVISLI